MCDLLQNRFVQSLGVAALVYLIFQALAWGMEAILRILESFSRWYRYHGVPWAEETAIAIGVIYLIVSAVISSRQN